MSTYFSEDQIKNLDSDQIKNLSDKNIEFFIEYFFK